MKEFRSSIYRQADKDEEDNGIPMVMCGNKADLVDERKVTEEVISSYKETSSLTYFETSAKVGSRAPRPLPFL